MTESRKYTPKEEAFLEALAGDAKGDVRLAKEMAEWTVPIKDIYSRLSEEITEIAKKLIAMDTVLAYHHLKGLLNEPEQLGARNKINVIKEILDRGGVVKKEHVEISSVEGGVVILPNKKTQDED